jgi:hypothetical protein
MDRGHAIGAVRADNRQIRHAHLFDGPLFDQAHARDARLVAGITPPHLVEEPVVNLMDDLEMPRQNVLEPGNRPALERFGKQRMIRVGEDPLRDGPRLIPAEAGVVQQNSHQLRNPHGRMSVVQLNGHLFGQQVPILVLRPELADDVVSRARAQEILLKEPQFLADSRRIVRIEHPGDRLRGERLGNRSHEIAVAELVKVKRIRGARGLQAQRIDGAAAVADHGPVERNPQQRGRLTGHRDQAGAANLKRAA